MKIVKVILVCLMALALNACASYAQKKATMVQEVSPDSYGLDRYISSQYPEYVTLVRLPDVNTTSKTIRID